jgi:hypothetical protein
MEAGEQLAVVFVTCGTTKAPKDGGVGASWADVEGAPK